jgi:hypothetical protein
VSSTALEIEISRNPDRERRLGHHDAASSRASRFGNEEGPSPCRAEGKED